MSNTFFFSCGPATSSGLATPGRRASPGRAAGGRPSWLHGRRAGPSGPARHGTPEERTIPSRCRWTRQSVDRRQPEACSSVESIHSVPATNVRSSGRSCRARSARRRWQARVRFRDPVAVETSNPSRTERRTSAPANPPSNGGSWGPGPSRGRSVASRGARSATGRARPIPVRSSACARATPHPSPATEPTAPARYRRVPRFGSRVFGLRLSAMTYDVRGRQTSHG